MASKAANHQPGRWARAIRWLFPSRAHVAITLAVEIVLAALGLPLWAHVTLGALVHLLATREDWRM